MPRVAKVRNGQAVFQKSLCIKVEYIAVYGFALDQWITLREVLGELDSKLRFASFAGL